MLEPLKPLYNKTLRPFALFLARFGVHPNHITISGLLFFIVSAWFVNRGNWRTAFVLVIAGSLFDGLDGVLARETGKKSVFGGILDSCCDRLTEIFLFAGLFLYYLKNPVINYTEIILCFTGVSGSLMVSYVKARCEGSGVVCSRGLLQRPERLILLMAGLLTGQTVMFWILLIISVLSVFTVIQRILEAALRSRKV
ncbi:MAG: CDP-alcohol phosphatidyltransferase family protein [Fibrobacter sp.]|nr:CDP-alcohol phosphatidyltransferase family protein [Fibrobacter sp.]